MNPQTAKIVTLIVTTLAGIIGAGILLSFKVSFNQYLGGEFSFNYGTKAASSPTAEKPTPAPLDNRVVQTPAPVRTVRQIDLTDRWISVGTTEPYFIRELNNKIDMFRVGDDFAGEGLGSGVRRDDKVIIEAYSWLDETSGKLELTVSEDGNSMSGTFTPKNDRAKEVKVRFVRSSS